MFKEKRELLSYPPWLLAIYGCIVAGVVIFFVYDSYTQPPTYGILATDVVNELTVTGEYQKGWRGNPVFYSPDHYIPGGNKLTHIHCDNKKDYDRYNVNLKTLKQEDLEDDDYELAKVAYPYTLYKGKDSLIHVKQGGCSLTFKMGYYDPDYKDPYDVWWEVFVKKVRDMF
ncbi:hypothetical protein IM792_20150 [Mucilaginibacter sp. JRF]|uniref:hypothetical protein n=1 Tax=Mucilaginibacter sp. JRF TaxID=2780088 RepID=UPI0018827F37|nr:hypothetical protein [Mucilaginibacter sp. JRF]MBE9586773.1 hypothetical protein [Mucilaginibacter sp. JRF]